ncbi:MAG: TVP38/TMEM64 family protein [Gammaproteobacteria bacterium]|nr:TVP38/TMEM64 family protein [Gammaproteobacteria bacterium]MBI5619175.1 TVP38/TMEM64 family protein [Gammaproteobacteria bacterium]
MTRRTGLLFAALGAALLAALLAALARSPALRDAIAVFLDWVDAHGDLGIVLLGAIDALAVVLLLPAFLITIGAGFLFGVVKGTAIITASTALGATAAYLIGRHALRGRVERWLAATRAPQALARSVAAGGWRAIALLRMIPLFPFKTSNYALGALGVPLRDYVIGTVLGVVPLTVVNVAIGAMAQDLADALRLGHQHRPPLAWALDGALLLLAFGAALLVARRARRVLLETAEPPP